MTASVLCCTFAGEILSDAQNDSGCVFVGASYFAKPQFILSTHTYNKKAVIAIFTTTTFFSLILLYYFSNLISPFFSSYFSIQSLIRMSI